MTNLRSLLFHATILFLACITMTSCEADETCIEQTWYQDQDQDGFGSSTITPQYTCIQPEGYVADNTDCDDQDAAVYPGAPEILQDGVDNDCSGSDSCYASTVACDDGHPNTTDDRWDGNCNCIGTASNTNGFTVSSTFYPTANAYITIDDDDDDTNIGGDGHPDSYTFFFTDGLMFDNDANVNNSSGDYLFSMATTKLAFLQVQVTDNSSLSTSSPVTGNTYAVSSTDDTVIMHDGQIDGLSPAYFDNGTEYGLGNENIGTFHTPGVQGPSIIINAINIDMASPANSTIDADYTMMNQNGVVITGHYNGPIGLIFD